MRSALHEAALSYAQRGWNVLPLHSIRSGKCTCRKGAKCEHAGKHPRTLHGLNDASCDSQKIRGWWKNWPDANIGIATGSKWGIIVLDVDDKNKGAGSLSLRALQDKHGWQPDTLVSFTGNGKHLVFKHPGRPVTISVSSLGAGLDIRGDGGYIVAPPSVHANGKFYSWEDQDKPIAEMPEWLSRLVCQDNQEGSTPQTAGLNGPVATPAMAGVGIPDGVRNQTLFHVASVLRWMNLTHPGLTVMLLVLNEQLCVPPLPVAEVIRIGAGASRYSTAFQPPKLFWLQFNVEDWFSDPTFAGRTAEQDGWRFNLLLRAWQRGGVLSSNTVELAKYAKAERTFAKHRKGILFDFVEYEVKGQRLLAKPELVRQYFEAAMKSFDNKTRGSIGGLKGSETTDHATARSGQLRP
jgi:hypothetical protein